MLDQRRNNWLKPIIESLFARFVYANQASDIANNPGEHSPDGFLALGGVSFQQFEVFDRAGAAGPVQQQIALEAYGGEREEAAWGMLSGIIGNIRSLIGI